VTSAVVYWWLGNATYYLVNAKHFYYTYAFIV